MLKVFKYIFKKNNGLSIVKYLLLGIAFQVYKRISGCLISTKIFNGQELILFPDCNVSSMYAYTKIPDEKEIEVLRRQVELEREKGKGWEIIFLDIGANIGSYSISMLDVCDRVVAFEAHPYTANRARMNFLLNGLDASEVKQVAVSDKSGVSYFSDFGGSSTVNRISNIKSELQVNVITLDEFVKTNHPPSVDKKFILKIDVEGHEREVLKGGEDFLKNENILGIVFECFADTGIFNLLDSYGFKAINKISRNNYYATKN